MRVAGLEIGISDLLAVVALIVSGLSYWSNRDMAAASKSMDETNKSMARATEESARTAREAVEHQRRTTLLERKACLAIATDHQSGGAQCWQQTLTSGRITNFMTIKVRNEGAFAAYDVIGTLTLEGNSVGALRDETLMIEPGEVGSLDFSLPDGEIPFDPERLFTFQARYRDGVEHDRLTIRFRFVEGTAPYGKPGIWTWNPVILGADVEVSDLCKPLAIGQVRGFSATSGTMPATADYP
jgi:hypothetical protein